MSKFIRDFKKFNESIKDDYANAYVNRINKERNELLLKVNDNPNYVFVLGADVKFQQSGKPNRCETNTYNFIKSKLENNETQYYPVGGYYFTEFTLFPVEHWWVYNSITKEHIEITPFGEMKNPWCYAGIINYDINNEILESRQVYDVDFF